MRDAADFMGQRMAWDFIFESPLVAVGEVHCATFAEFVACIRHGCRLPQDAGDYFADALQMAKHKVDDEWGCSGGTVVDAAEPYDTLRPMRIDRNDVGALLMVYQGDKGPLFVHW
jgi:hypothetical protein